MTVSFANYRSLTDGSPEVHSLMYREEISREHRQHHVVTVLTVRVPDPPFPQLHLLLPVCQEVNDALTGGCGHSELCES